MCVSICVCASERVYVCMSICLSVCVCVCVCVCVHAHTTTFPHYSVHPYFVCIPLGSTIAVLTKWSLMDFMSF